ncbi:MAG: serine protease [Polyangiaceae bacterium]
MSDSPFSGSKIDHTSKAVQELIGFLASQIFYREEVSEVVAQSGVPVANVNWTYPPRLLWKDVLDVAHRFRKLDALFDTLRERDPQIRERMENLLSPAPVLAIVPGTAKATWQGGKELQLGAQSTLLDIQFLNDGLVAAAAVCKLTVQFPGQSEGWGTGSLIAPDLVLTNRHVLFDEDAGHARTERVSATFFNETGKTPVHVEGLVETCRFDDQHDCAIVRIASKIEGVQPLKLQPKAAIRRGDPAFIIQHPGGGPKRVGLYRNEIKYVDDDVIQYLTDTEGGSSGSPVFNKNWEVVGLHNQWIELAEATGAGGRKEIAVRNQGVRITHVASWLQRIGALP